MRLAQVFGNLLNNAAKYSDSGGDNHRRGRGANRERPSSRSATQGDGIEPEQLPQLFQIFTRGEPELPAQSERPRDRPRAGAPADGDARRAGRGRERRLRTGVAASPFACP